MKKVFVIFIIFSAIICSCKPSPADWENDFTGSWLLSGSAELNWHSIEDMTDGEVVKAINSRLSPSEMTSTLEFGNRIIEFTVDGESLGAGTYDIDNDGIVSVSWGEDGVDTYWMFVMDNILYMIEYDIDDYGEVSGVQTAYKFSRMSSVPSHF